MQNKRKSGFVSLVGAGPGDPGLLTLRGGECLVQADMVVYDRLANPLLLSLASRAEMVPVGKQPGHHPVPQNEINQILVKNARLGKWVVRLKGGDPFVFGRGGEEALCLREAGIPYEIVPGVTSAIAAPAYAGIPVTHREVAGSVAFITGHRTEGLDDRGAQWLGNDSPADTLVFLMGVRNLPRIVDRLRANGRAADTPVALIERGTTTSQKTVLGTLSNIVDKAADIRPPAVCIVGEVVNLRNQLRWYDVPELHPLFGLRVLNTRSISDEGRHLSGPDLLLQDDFNALVSAQGAEVIHTPVLQIVPATDANLLREAVRELLDPDAFNWVVFSSVNGVRFFFIELSRLGADTRSLKGIKVAAIGPATAKALTGRGIQPDFVPGKFTGADLGQELPLSPGESLLLPRSEIGLPELPKILTARGGVVRDVPAYAVKPSLPDPLVVDQLVSGQIDVVTFFSPSGLYGLTEILKAAGQPTPLVEILAPLSVACIGPTTEKTALEMGIEAEIVAREHTSAGLVREMVKWRKVS